MKTLILVDLDNVLRDPRSSNTPQEWRLPGSKPSTWVCVNDRRPKASFVQRASSAMPDGGAVVVIAFNESTASARGGSPLTSRVLLQLADAAAARLGVPGEVRVEVIPVRSVPQAADAALVVALCRCPDESVAGAFERVVLVSGDTGLRQTIGDHLPSGTSERHADDFFPHTIWRLATPHTRTSPGPDTPPAESERLCGYSAVVDTPGKVTAAAARRFRWDDPSEFSAFAAKTSTRMERSSVLGPKRVERMSFLGPTRASARGIARLGELLTRRPDPIELVPMSHLDGVELPNPPGTFYPGRVTRVEAASIGQGAFRLPELEATLPTRLPIGIVEAVVAATRPIIESPDLDDTWLIRRIKQPTLEVPPLRVRVEVRLRSMKKLSFSVRSNGGAVSNWWVETAALGVGQFKVQSEIACDGAAGLSVAEASVEAIATVHQLLGPPSVGFWAPATRPLAVSPTALGWELALGRNATEAGLVLLPDAETLSKCVGESVCLEVQRIQSISVPPASWLRAFSADLWDLLLKCPILVPCQWARAQDVSLSGGGEA